MSAGGGVSLAGLAHFLGDLELDRQPVAIPARDVRRADAAQGLVLDDDVLENLVQRRADVDIAVGERRAVMQHKFRRARRAGPGPGLKVLGLPFLQAFGFPR